MRCKKYLEWLEKGNYVDNDINYGNISIEEKSNEMQIHINQCNDCFNDSKARTKLIKLLSTLPEPIYPENLKDQILAEIYFSPHTNDLVNNMKDLKYKIAGIDEMFDKILKPIQYTLALIVIICIFQIISISSFLHLTNSKNLIFNEANHNNIIKPNKNVTLLMNRYANNNYSTSSSNNLRKVINTKEIIPVSKEEVENFLKKLAEFKSKHPELFYDQSSNKLEIELVNFE